MSVEVGPEVRIGVYGMSAAGTVVHRCGIVHRRPDPAPGGAFEGRVRGTLEPCPSAAAADPR
ncbi:hypothetical protein GCM10022238_11310 [Gordonia hankookensis]